MGQTSQADARSATRTIHVDSVRIPQPPQATIFGRLSAASEAR
jgi:hypothetical protein